MKLKFVKLIRVPYAFRMSDGTERPGYRYVDIDGGIVAEALKGEVYPSAVRELELEMQAEAKAEAARAAEKAKVEQEEQAEWETLRKQMAASLDKG